MQIEFSTSHIETLTKLFEIAKKHNGTINFGTAHFSERLELSNLKGIMEIDDDTLELFEELKDDILDGEITREFEEVWFKLILIEHGCRTCHTMSYQTVKTIIRINPEFIDNIDKYTFEEDHATEFVGIKLKDWLVEMIAPSGVYIEFYNAPTKITGFGNSEPIEDYRVYRSGMALKYFADLVTDYLNEEPIKNTY